MFRSRSVRIKVCAAMVVSFALLGAVGNGIRSCGLFSVLARSGRISPARARQIVQDFVPNVSSDHGLAINRPSSHPSLVPDFDFVPEILLTPGNLCALLTLLGSGGALWLLARRRRSLSHPTSGNPQFLPRPENRNPPKSPTPDLCITGQGLLEAT